MILYARQVHGAVKALVGEYTDTLRRHPLALSRRRPTDNATVGTPPPHSRRG